MNESKSPLILDDAENPSSKVNEKEIKETSKKVIPNDYIPIKLHSKGVLDAPKVLYYRDYTMEDALKLNVLDEEDQLKALIEVLTDMSYEKFDASKLNVKELMEIMYSIHGAFIGSKVEKSYYYNEDFPKGKEEGQVDHPSNVGKIEIPLDKLMVKYIDEDDKGHTLERKFKEPFTIQDSIKRYKIQLRLSRIGDLTFAQEYCNKMYEEEVQRFNPLKRSILRLRDVEDEEERMKKFEELVKSNEEEYTAYNIFLDKWQKLYIKIIQALVLVSIDGVALNTIEEKLNAYENRISETMWETYQEVVDNYNFGIIEKVTFFCEKNQKNVTRRFQFQYSEFLPTSEKKYRTRYNVEFD